MTQNLPALHEAQASLPQAWSRGGDVVAEFACELEKRWRVAQYIAASGLTQHRKPEAIITIQLAAFEVGLPIMQALRGMYLVNGKLAMEGHLMDALAIQRCGVKKTIKERSWRRCEMVLHRDGWSDVPVEFDLTDAKRAGLISGWDESGDVKSAKEPWRKHPRNMLYWRALSDGLRIIAPDYFGGVYTEDEIHEIAEAQVVASGNRSTMEELAAAIGGDRGSAPVEPDPLILEADEIEKLRNEANNAELAGIIDADLKNDALDAAVKGEWQRARDLWDVIRSAVMRAEADAPVQQGALL